MTVSHSGFYFLCQAGHRGRQEGGQGGVHVGQVEVHPGEGREGRNAH